MTDLNKFESLKDLNFEGNKFKNLPSNFHIQLKSLENLNIDLIEFYDVSSLLNSLFYLFSVQIYNRHASENAQLEIIIYFDF